MRLSEHLYVYLWNDPRENNCNSIVIDGKVPLLIDPGHYHRVNDLFDRMNEDGLDPRKIKVVICTHCHPDHFEGTLAFKEGHVKIGIALQEERLIEEMVREQYVRQGKAMPDFRVDFYLKEGELVLGKHEFQVLLTPGHSPGGISLYWPRHKALFPGDLIFAQGIGRTDLPGGNTETLKNSIQRLAGLPVELAIPGHGSPIQGAERVKGNFEFIKRMLLTVR
jgi:hydroxyacylglutathione hydrolase